MKNVFTSLTAILMVVWYSLSVIGFDVHTCSGSGETYIATVASGFTCEDIHPEYGHSGCSCCHAEESETASSRQELDKKPCCTDDYHVIILTGTRGGDEQRYDNAHHLAYCHLVADVPYDNTCSSQFLSDLQRFRCDHHGTYLSRSLNTVYNIWRI